MSEPTKCECGADLIRLHGRVWCAVTLAKYRLFYGEPKQSNQG